MLLKRIYKTKFTNGLNINFSKILKFTIDFKWGWGYIYKSFFKLNDKEINL